MKILVPNYSFDASAKTVTFTDYNPLDLKSVLLITNVTDNIIIYNFAQVGKGGTAATNILTLDFDTTGMDDADELQIFYDDPNATQEITGGLTDSELRASPVDVDTGLIQPIQDGGDVVVTNLPADYALPASQVSTLTPQTDALTDTELRATPVPVDTGLSQPIQEGGSVDVNNFPADYPLPSAQITTLTPQTDALTDTELRATPVPVDTGLSPLEDGGDVNVTNFPSEYPLPVAQVSTLTPQTNALTDTELRATPVPVSGTVTADAGTDLNTSLLALESGGNLAAIAGKDFATQTTLAAIAGSVDGVEGLLTTIDADTSALAATDFATQTTLSAINAKLVTGTDIGDVTINNANGASAVNIQDGGNSITVDGTINAVGAIAHDTTNTSGNRPSVRGAEAISFGTTATAVAEGDVTKTFADIYGIPFTIVGSPNTLSFRVNYTAAQTNTAIVTVAGGTKIQVQQIMVAVDNACTVDVQARIGLAAATTPTGASTVFTHPNMSAGSAIIAGIPGGNLFTGADGEDLRITSTVPTGGSIDILVTYKLVAS